MLGIEPRSSACIHVPSPSFGPSLLAYPTACANHESPKRYGDLLHCSGLHPIRSASLIFLNLLESLRGHSQLRAEKDIRRHRGPPPILSTGWPSGTTCSLQQGYWWYFNHRADGKKQESHPGMAEDDIPGSREPFVHPHAFFIFKRTSNAGRASPP